MTEVICGDCGMVLRCTRECIIKVNSNTTCVCPICYVKRTMELYTVRESLGVGHYLKQGCWDLIPKDIITKAMSMEISDAL